MVIPVVLSVGKKCCESSFRDLLGVERVERVERIAILSLS